MTDGERIIRLETQMNNIDKKVEDGFKAIDIRFDKMETLINAFVKTVGETYTTKEEFSPVKKVVYGAVTIALVAVLGTILALIGLKYK